MRSEDASSFNPECGCGPGATFNDKYECVGGTSKQQLWNQFWLDLHSDKCKASAKEIMGKRIQLAVDKRCDGVDPDNVDSVSHSRSVTYKKRPLMMFSKSTVLRTAIRRMIKRITSCMSYNELIPDTTLMV